MRSLLHFCFLPGIRVATFACALNALLTISAAFDGHLAAALLFCAVAGFLAGWLVCGWFVDGFGGRLP